MIETETIWHDSGYDCDHCGGQIFQRTDQITNQPARVCYQCKMCGCQWQLSGDVLRVGKMNSCRRAQQDRVETYRNEKFSATQIRLVVGAGILLLLGIIYFGGLVAIRFLIPVSIVLFLFWSLFRLGKERMWW